MTTSLEDFNISYYQYIIIVLFSLPGWVLTKEERILRQNKRTKNKKPNQSPTNFPKVYDVEDSPSFGPKTNIPKRLVCPVMPNDLKQIDQRQKCFVKLSTDNYIRYFVSRPQVSAIVYTPLFRNLFS